MSKTVEELQAELRQYPTIIRGLGRFDAKLTFDERCSVLALYLSGIHRRVLAAAYGIDRRTVAHIYNKNSIHYKAVRKELENLGRDLFLQRYLTEEATRKAQSVANHPDVVLPDENWRKQPDKATLPSKRKNRKEGVHVIKPDQCDYSHRVVIGYRYEESDPDLGTVSPEGWWYQDLDGNNPDLWLHCGPESLLSSANALRFAEQEIIDKL